MFSFLIIELFFFTCSEMQQLNELEQFNKVYKEHVTN
jgi:hypothetical protein